MVHSENDGGVVIGPDGIHYLDHGTRPARTRWRGSAPTRRATWSGRMGSRTRRTSWSSAFTTPRPAKSPPSRSWSDLTAVWAGLQTQPFVLFPVQFTAPSADRRGRGSSCRAQGLAELVGRAVTGGNICPGHGPIVETSHRRHVGREIVGGRHQVWFAARGSGTTMRLSRLTRFLACLLVVSTVFGMPGRVRAEAEAEALLAASATAMGRFSRSTS